MGWKNSPPIFSAATETAADIANTNINNPQHSPPHHQLNSLAASMDEQPSSFPSCTPCSSSTTSSTATPTPTMKDPCLPATPNPTAYVDVYVDDFLALAQGKSNKTRVRKILLHAVDSIFRPNDSSDSSMRREPISIKNCTKETCHGLRQNKF